MVSLQGVQKRAGTGGVDRAQNTGFLGREGMPADRDGDAAF